MREAMAVAECSRRLLSVFRGGNLQEVEGELSRAKRVCKPLVADSSLAGEQAELLEAIVERIPLSPLGDAEIFLLEHLANKTWSGCKTLPVR